MLTISLDGPDEILHLESLCDWLRIEPELAGCVTLTGYEPRPGEMGVLDHALIVALGSGGAISALAASLVAWCKQPRKSDIRVRLTGKTGRLEEIEAKRINEEQVNTIIRLLVEDERERD